MKPEFPEFKPITLDDRDVIHRMLWQYQPDTSELTFTNLFIWRAHYGFLWSVYRDWLLIVGGNSENGVQALPPIGPSSRVEVTAMLLQWLKENRGIPRPHIDRADRKLVSELQASPNFLCEPMRDHFDYVYRTADLIELAGKGYRQQRNHTNYLLRTYKMTYEPMNESHVDSCLNLARNWCEARQCEEDLSFASEGEQTGKRFRTSAPLGSMAGSSSSTAGSRPSRWVSSSTATRRLSTSKRPTWKIRVPMRDKPAVLREEMAECACHQPGAGSGPAGLRKAKLSYNPDHMIEKFRAGLLT